MRSGCRAVAVGVLAFMCTLSSEGRSWGYYCFQAAPGIKTLVDNQCTKYFNSTGALVSSHPGGPVLAYKTADGDGRSCATDPSTPFKNPVCTDGGACVAEEKCKPNYPYSGGFPGSGAGPKIETYGGKKYCVYGQWAAYFAVSICAPARPCGRAIETTVNGVKFCCNTPNDAGIGAGTASFCCTKYP